MPICTEPGQTFEVALALDRPKPPAMRPVFVARALSVREARRVMQLKALAEGAAVSGGDPLAMTDQVMDVLRASVVGWRHMGRDFSAEALADVLTLPEAIELVTLLASGQSPSGEDLGNSGSPSRTSTDACATADAEAGASAPTPPDH